MIENKKRLEEVFMRFSKKKTVNAEHRCKWCNVQCVTVRDRVVHERSCARSRD